MADTMTPEQRSRCMSAVKGKDTKPEMIVRKYLFSKGLRYRLHVGSLPGRPDIVLPRYRAVVFIDGCFWHGHDGCRYFRLPKSNAEFWQTKITNNVARDALNRLKLEQMGWRVIRIWECEIRRVADREQSLDRLYRRIVAAPVLAPEAAPEVAPVVKPEIAPMVAPGPYADPQPSLPMAAEAPAPYSTPKK